MNTHYHLHPPPQAITAVVVSRGSGPFVPSIFYFSGMPLFPIFFVLAGKANTQKQTDAEQRSNKERPFFRQDDNPPPPSSRFSDWSPAPLVDQSENWRPSVHVLFNSTCTDGRRFVVFFVGVALGRSNMVNCCVFFVEPPSMCQSESFKDAEWRVEGGGMSPHASEQAATQGGC